MMGVMSGKHRAWGIPAASDRLLNKVNEDGDHIVFRLSGRGCQAQYVAESACNTLGELYQSIFVVTEVLKVPVKDKRPSVFLLLISLTGSKLMGTGVLPSLHCVPLQ